MVICVGTFLFTSAAMVCVGYVSRIDNIVVQSKKMLHYSLKKIYQLNNIHVQPYTHLMSCVLVVNICNVLHDIIVFHMINGKDYATCR